MAPQLIIGRRAFLSGIAAAGVSAAGLTALAGCGSDTSPGGGATGGGSGTGAGVLPTYRRFEGIAPDLVGDETGVPNAFMRYPEPVVAATTGRPGGGGTVTAMLGLAGEAAPVPMGRNSWWQGLNERLGVELQINISPQDYESKLAAVIAGGDLPDLVQIPVQGATATPRLPELLGAQFEDLTEHLAGDAVLDYPFLANLPEYMWRTTVFNGGIFAVPPSNLVGQPTWLARMDVIEGAGLDLAPQDADDLLDLCVSLTDDSSNRYAFAHINTAFTNLAAAMFDAPNNWERRDDGSFVHMYETEEYLAALEYTVRLWDAGVFHPDTFASANFPELFKAGSIVFGAWGGVGYKSILRENIPGLELAFWNPPRAEGGGHASKRLGTGTYQLCGIRKQESPDRVRELLAVLNYLAAPFGTAEHLYLKYGDEGVHHTWDEQLQAPVETSKFTDERLSTSILASAPFELFDPGHSDVTTAMYEHQKASIPEGRRDASVGLYSASNSRNGAALVQAAEDLRNEIIQGRASIDDWGRAVDDWRAGGGDEIRGEYEESYAQAQG